MITTIKLTKHNINDLCHKHHKSYMCTLVFNYLNSFGLYFGKTLIIALKQFSDILAQVLIISSRKLFQMFFSCCHFSSNYVSMKSEHYRSYVGVMLKNHRKFESLKM